MLPSSYLKIDNFYTATIYEKGAEVIRMLKTLIGPEKFREGMDLYFDRWDGHATTVEEFIRCFAEVTGEDLSDFFAWYEQAGTPKVSLKHSYDAGARTLQIDLSQHTRRPLASRTSGRCRSRSPSACWTAKAEPGLRARRQGARPDRGGAGRRPGQRDAERRRCGPSDLGATGFSAPVTLTTDAPAKDRYVQLA